MQLSKDGAIPVSTPMAFYTLPDHNGHEQVCYFFHKQSGLKAIIAIHDTTLGPALGGVRMYPYKTDEEALTDVLRLSEGMSYKAAAAGLKLGGGKAVIIGDPKKDKTVTFFRAFGKCIQSLGGRYITAEDVGTDVNDMEYIRMETPYVTGGDILRGGSGNPAPFTAFGCAEGLKAAAEYKLGKSDLSDVTISVQGLGSVGWELVKQLKTEFPKTRFIATDIDSARCEKAKKELGVDEIVSPDEIYGVNADIFAPCALGSVINDNTIDQLKVKVIAGAANNQLKKHRHGDQLYKMGILYTPDYVINAGGLINVYIELEGYSRERARRLCYGISYNCRRVFDISEKEKIPTYLAADRLVEDRMKAISELKARFNTFPRESFDLR